MSDNGRCGTATGQSPALRELLLVNQVAGPLNRKLLEDLTKQGVCCKVVAGWVEASRIPGPDPFETIHAKPLVKAPAAARLWSRAVFTLQAVLHIVRNRRMPVMVTTNPPSVMLAMPLLKRLFGIRYVLLIYDIHPDLLRGEAN